MQKEYKNHIIFCSIKEYNMHMYSIVLSQLYCIVSRCHSSQFCLRKGEFCSDFEMGRHWALQELDFTVSCDCFTTLASHRLSLRSKSNERHFSSVQIPSRKHWFQWLKLPYDVSCKSREGYDMMCALEKYVQYFQRQVVKTPTSSQCLY